MYQEICQGTNTRRSRPASIPAACVGIHSTLSLSILARNGKGGALQRGTCAALTRGKHAAPLVCGLRGRQYDCLIQVVLGLRSLEVYYKFSEAMSVILFWYENPYHSLWYVIVEHRDTRPAPEQ